jgi:hypothetical protein
MRMPDPSASESKRTRRHLDLPSILVRIGLTALGGLAIAWGVYVFPISMRDTPIERVAGQIVNGAPFRSEALLGLQEKLSLITEAERCHPSAIHAAAIVRLRILEDSLQGSNPFVTQSHSNNLRRAIFRGLACSPADPFLWLTLFSLNTAEGFTPRGETEVYPRDLSYLRMSYLTGPNEGWVAFRRNPISLNFFQQLEPDLRGKAIDEFAGLLSSKFYDAVFSIFTGPGWPLRDQLLSRLQSVPERQRQTFARMLFAEDYDVKVPGIDIPDRTRPWQH